MAQFTVRDFDEDLYKSLKERAERHHRSLEAEVRDMLTRMLSRPALSPAERKERLRELAAIRKSIDPEKIKGLDVLAILREDRDRDS